MRFLIKLALMPVWIIVAVCWMLAAIVSRVYSVTHGFLWAILLVPVVLACLLQMWQNAAVFLAVGVISYLVLFGLTAAEVLLETARIAIGRTIRI